MSQIHSFRHLRVVAAVARWERARGAATRVNLSPPAISQAITAVERAVGELFDRTAPQDVRHRGRSGVRRSHRASDWILEYRCADRRGAPTGSTSDAFLSRLATTVQLRAVVGVIEHGGYAPAARQLGVTQPNVHRNPGSGEDDGAPSVSAVAFQASPTPEALVLARYTQLAFREIELGLEELRGLRGLRMAASDRRAAIAAYPDPADPPSRGWSRDLRTPR